MKIRLRSALPSAARYLRVCDVGTEETTRDTDRWGTPRWMLAVVDIFCLDIEDQEEPLVSPGKMIYTMVCVFFPYYFSGGYLIGILSITGKNHQTYMWIRILSRGDDINPFDILRLSHWTGNPVVSKSSITTSESGFEHFSLGFVHSWEVNHPIYGSFWWGVCLLISSSWILEFSCNSSTSYQVITTWWNFWT